MPASADSSRSLTVNLQDHAYEKYNGEEVNGMSKERSTVKEGKKQPTMTPKERKAAKKAKKEAARSRHS